MSSSFYTAVLTTLGAGLSVVLVSFWRDRAAKAYAGTPLRDAEFYTSRAYYFILIPGVALFEACGLHILYIGKFDWGNVVFAAPFILIGLAIGIYGWLDIILTQVIIRDRTVIYRKLWKEHIIDLSEMKFVSSGSGHIVIDTGVIPRIGIPMQFARSGELLAMLESYWLKTLLDKANAARGADNQTVEQDEHK